VPYLSASAVVIHYEEVLYQVYGPRKRCWNARTNPVISFLFIYIT